MRKQYHFRKIKNDTLIWDVDKLIILSKNLPIKKVLIDDIKELNEAYWYSNKYPTTKEIIEHFKLLSVADLTYPIILCEEGRVMDGMHRVAKAYMQDLKFIKAVQFEKTPKEDFKNIEENELNYN